MTTGRGKAPATMAKGQGTMMEQNVEKALSISEKVVSLITGALRPLETTINGWPAEFRAVIWEALVVIASQNAEEARKQQK